MKSNRVTVRLDENMLLGLEKQKKELEAHSLSELIREAVKSCLQSDQPQLSRELVEEFTAWRKEFHGVGSNLNQIAYRMNSGHPQASQQVLETLKELSASFKKLAEDFKKVRHGFDF
ncbi:plasmid mobilization relaxosome protein MobC [Pseudodesulfovibrio sp. JC047]|uniref:ribbon-helix-helix protein, CopG family n=1 Tax=Pseudodesulfovibrio sp. JC047 TaxID=2683199 RepID=UPI0013D0772A|nr:plasmid mobilization relaxosome protein MobC [Pseudodesulfovibrio sp. JC047]NDV20373.1 plasmid mobilization relaxosome protein MobC [Pseudodesulfovibrio sp. JC047]